MFNFAGNVVGTVATIYSASDPDLSTNRKIWRTTTNGIPAAIGIAGIFGLSFTGATEVSLIIGGAGYAGEVLYDDVLAPSIQQIEDWINWFENVGYNSFYSDKNLKENITPIDSSLYKVLTLNGYTFDWKDTLLNNEKKDIGVIAQEVEKVYPELVTSDSSGYKMVYYYKLIPILIEALKDQQDLLNKQNDILKEYKMNTEYNEKILNSVLIRLDELEIKNKE